MSYQPSYRPATTTSTLAVVSLVFGILSWLVLPFVGALIAVVCGHLARSEIRRSEPGSLSGDGLALTGLILGYLHLACWVFGALLIMGMVWFGLSLPLWTAGWH